MWIKALQKCHEAQVKTSARASGVPGVRGKWPVYIPAEQITMMSEHQSVFSACEGALGCTNLIKYEILLLDDVPA